MSGMPEGVSFGYMSDMNRLIAADRGRGGAVWRPRGGQCGANVGAVDFAVFAPEGTPEECVESAGW